MVIVGGCCKDIVQTFISSRLEMIQVVIDAVVQYQRQLVSATAVSAECSSQADDMDRSARTRHPFWGKCTGCLSNTRSNSRSPHSCSRYCIAWHCSICQMNAGQSLLMIFWQVDVCCAMDQALSEWQFICCCLEHAAVFVAFGRQLHVLYASVDGAFLFDWHNGA